MNTLTTLASIHAIVKQAGSYDRVYSDKRKGDGYKVVLGHRIKYLNYGSRTSVDLKALKRLLAPYDLTAVSIPCPPWQYYTAFIIINVSIA